MNIVEAGHELLVLLAISDRHYHINEVNRIKEFLAKHLNEGKTVEVKSPIEIISLPTETRVQRLGELAEYFKHHSSIKNKLRMINFALHLILADHKVTPEEKLRFKILGEYWDIDLVKFIEKKLANNADAARVIDLNKIR